jgi:hypothetical protein
MPPIAELESSADFDENVAATQNGLPFVALFTASWKKSSKIASSDLSNLHDTGNFSLANIELDNEHGEEIALDKGVSGE